MSLTTMEADRSTTGDAALPLSPKTLVDRVETARNNWRRFLRIRTTIRVILVFLVLGGLLALADYYWLFSQSFRQAIWMILGSLAAGYVFLRLVRPRPNLSRRETAGEIETAFPHLGQRVCTTLEYAEPTPTTMPAWPSMVKALSVETQQRTYRLDFEQVVPWRRLRWPVATLASLVTTIIFLLFISPAVWIAIGRLFLIPVQYTQLEVKPGNQSIKAGGDFKIQAIISGRPVDEVEVVYRKAAKSMGNSPSNPSWTSIWLGAHATEGEESIPGLTGTLETTLKNCREDVEYRVIAGPVESETYRLTIIHSLALKKIEAHIEPPAYTRQKPQTVEKGDISVLSGSAVRFHFTLDRAPQTAWLRLTPAKGVKEATEQSLPPVPLKIENNLLLGTLDRVTHNLDYEILAEAADGTKLDARRFHLQVSPDRPPTIRFIKPKAIIEVTPSTEVTMEVEAKDDYGLSKLGIAFKIGDGPEMVLHLKENPDQPVSLSSLATLYLEEHSVSFPGGVVYYAFVEDNCPMEPHYVTSEVQYIDIRPYKREYQLVEGGGT